MQSMIVLLWQQGLSSLSPTTQPPTGHEPGVWYHVGHVHRHACVAGGGRAAVECREGQEQKDFIKLLSPL